jgi:hypothetical protein
MCSSDLVEGASPNSLFPSIGEKVQGGIDIARGKGSTTENIKKGARADQLGLAHSFGGGGLLFERHRRGDFEESIEAPEVAQVRDTTDEQRATKERQQRLSEQRRRSASSTAATRLTSPLGVNQRAAVGRKSLLGQ